MSRASGFALAAVLVALSAGSSIDPATIAAALQDPVREADPPCRKAAASQDPDGEELVGLFSTKTNELLDASGAARAKPAVVVIFMNLDGGKKRTQYVLKRARKVAAERKGLSFAVASLEGSKDDMVDSMVKATLLAAACVANTTLTVLHLLRAALWAREESQPLGLRRKILPVADFASGLDHSGRLRARVQVGLRRTHGHHAAHAQQGPEACGVPVRCSWASARILRVDRRLQRGGARCLCRRIPRGRSHRARQAGPKRRAVSSSKE